MSALPERPRAAGAAALAVLVVVIAAMLAGGALAGGDTPSASDQERVALAHAKRHARAAASYLAATRTQLRTQAANLRTATTKATSWRRRALRAERRLQAKSTRTGRSQRDRRRSRRR